MEITKILTNAENIRRQLDKLEPNMADRIDNAIIASEIDPRIPSPFPEPEPEQ